MGVAEVLALLLANMGTAQKLADLIGRLSSGQQPTADDHALLKQEQAVEEARTDALTGHGPTA